MIKIARMTTRELAILGDLRPAAVPGRFDPWGNFSAAAIIEGQPALRWTPTGPECDKFWKGWLPTYRWTYEGGVLRQFSRQNVAELLAQLPNAPVPIGEYSFCFGPAVEGDISELQAKNRYTERLYAVYQASDGDYYLAKGNATFSGWDSHERLVFVPSGAYHPSIAFDENGRFTMAAEFQPAGGEIELWIYQYPYTGDAIRCVVSGIYCRTPVLFLDPDTDVLYFYGNSTNIRYRAKSQNYAIEHTLPIVADDHINLHAIRWFDQGGHFYRIIVAFSQEDEKFLRYTCTIGFRYERFAEALTVQTGLTDIGWEEYSETERTYEEFITVQTALVNIGWIGTTTIAREFYESVLAETNLQAISWVEITIEQYSASESIVVQCGMVSILWVEPGEE